MVNRPDTEVAYILSGTATITDDTTGVAHDVTAGDRGLPQRRPLPELSDALGR